MEPGHKPGTFSSAKTNFQLNH